MAILSCQDAGLTCSIFSAFDLALVAAHGDQGVLFCGAGWETGKSADVDERDAVSDPGTRVSLLPQSLCRIFPGLQFALDQGTLEKIFLVVGVVQNIRIRTVSFLP